MHIVYATDPMPPAIVKSIFLAGPSPRKSTPTENFVDWRQTALTILHEMNYDGTVFIPIPESKFGGSNKDDSATWTYDTQIEWECEARHIADQIVYWVARDIAGAMPGFTTNIEFGEDLDSGKMVFGRPALADGTRYMDQRLIMAEMPIFDSLSETLEHAVDNLGLGKLRKGGEIYVPLFIWNTPQFTSWYANVLAAGNKLHSAKVISHITSRNHFVFSFTMHVSVWVEAENRYKDNEVLFTRTDTSSVVAWHEDLQGDVFIVLVKEFRSPVNNKLGMVYELPSGSSFKPDQNPLANARDELSEEIGLFVDDISRFKFVDTRQLAATFSTHVSYLYQVELSMDEFIQVREAFENNTEFGDGSERTYIELVKVHELCKYPVDFTTMGMIYNTMFDISSMNHIVS